MIEITIHRLIIHTHLSKRGRNLIRLAVVFVRRVWKCVFIIGNKDIYTWNSLSISFPFPIQMNRKIPVILKNEFIGYLIYSLSIYNGWVFKFHGKFYS